MNMFSCPVMCPAHEPKWYTSETGSLGPPGQCTGSFSGILVQVYSSPVLLAAPTPTTFCNLFPLGWHEEQFWFGLLRKPFRDSPDRQLTGRRPGNHWCRHQSFSYSPSQWSGITMKARIYLSAWIFAQNFPCTSLLNPLKTPMRQVPLLSPFYTWGN